MLTVSECLQAYLKAKDGMIVSHDRAQFAVQKLEARIGMEAVGKGLFNATTRYARQRGHEVTASTIRRELNVLKASLHHAVKTGRIEYVPSLYETKAGSPRMRVLNDREIAALMNEVNSNRHPAWLRNFVILLLLTGQRKSAILGLTWGRVDLIERVIHFPDSSLSLSERRKGRGTVPINDDLFYVLNHAAKSWSSKGDQHVIQSNGHAVTAIYDAWNKLMSASGLNGVTPHVLRHTVATNLVRSNADIYQVSKLLGHASVRTTESIYVHHDAEVLRPMMNLLTAGGKA